MHSVWRTEDSLVSLVLFEGAGKVARGQPGTLSTIRLSADVMGRDSMRTGSVPRGSDGGACVDGAENSFEGVDSATEDSTVGSAAAAGGTEVDSARDELAAGCVGGAAATTAGAVATEALSDSNRSAMAEQVIPFLGGIEAAIAAFDGDGDTT